jgi:membrane carboxypeptidase/penicillin-binding protein PbpC
MALFANSISHKAGSGLVSGAQAYFSKEPTDLTRAEALELILADYTNSPDSKHIEFLRRACL